MLFKKILSTIALFTLILSPSFSFAVATSSFSFTVFGDSRLPGNMNFSVDQQGPDGEIARYIKANFVGKTIDDFTLNFNKSGKLINLRVPKTGETYKDITFDSNGWPANIIDTSQTPNLTLLEGGLDWVYKSVIDSVTSEGTEGFVIHTGDISYNGYYGTEPTTVYWADFKKRLLDKLPEGYPKGLFGRFYPAVGNHETWLDKDMQGLRNTVPYLKTFNVTADRHMYLFDYNNSRFIFLDTGGYDPPAGWGYDSQPAYPEQIKKLKEWLEQAQQNNISHVFITLHKPPFCDAGHGHLDKDTTSMKHLSHTLLRVRTPLI